MDIFQLSALELGKKIKSKEIGVVEATKAVLENIEKIPLLFMLIVV